MSETDKQLCEENISGDELKTIMKSFKKNKSPGNDGITIEFYEKFWDLIEEDFVGCFQDVFKEGLLSTSQRQAIITLLEKPGKDRSLIKNWRPISLLNVDYKIVSKVLATRLKQVLPTVIHSDQSGYIPNRYIGETIRLIQDMMEYTKVKAILLILLDFEKAFDSIEWKFLEMTLQKI